MSSTSFSKKEQDASFSVIFVQIRPTMCATSSTAFRISVSNTVGSGGEIGPECDGGLVSRAYNVDVVAVGVLILPLLLAALRIGLMFGMIV